MEELKIKIPHNYEARPYQRPFWTAMENGFKRAVCVWHRRAGKDLTALTWTTVASTQRVGIYYHFLPTYSQGRKIIWDGKDRDARPFLDYWPSDWIASQNNTEMKLSLRNGSLWQVVGTDDIDRIVGTNPCGCVFSEYSLQNPKAWTFFQPILAENRGWAVFLYTPRGRNHGYDQYLTARKLPDWFCELLTVDNTQAISYEAIDAERRAGMSEDMIQQEFYCSFDLGIEGAYYARLMAQLRQQGRMVKQLYNRNALVHTAWDLGVGDSTAIWFFQLAGPEIHLIDYYEHQGAGMAHYSHVLQTKHYEEGYVYDQHLAPHDIEDREKSTGMPLITTAKREHGIDFTVVPRIPHLWHGIEAVRGILPRCWFDEEKCERGISALSNYRKEYDDKKQAYYDQPIRDWTRHGADGFRQLAQAIRNGQVGRKIMTAEEAARLYEMYGPPRTVVS